MLKKIMDTKKENKFIISILCSINKAVSLKR